MDYTIKKEENELFSKWELFKKQSNEDFCPNGGLLFRGDFGINTEPNNKGKFTWNRMPANEEELWYKSCKRLMILTKDQNDDESWDIREESGGRKHLKNNQLPSEKELQFNGNRLFHKILSRWVFGIYEEHNGKYPSFEEVQDYKKTGLYYEKVPLVRINCKIELGSSSVDNEDLIESMNKNKSFLIEQLKMYKANIILCCGHNQKKGNVILNFVKEHYLKDMEIVHDSGEWLYYSKDKNIIIIDSYHPSYSGVTEEWSYCELVKNFSQSVSKKKINFLPLTE